jgi:hypothetical protein
MSYANRRPRPVYLAALLLAATLSSTSCDPGSTAVNQFMADEQFSFTYDVVDQLRLDLEAINGNIRITGVVDATTITVEGTLLVWSDSPEDAQAGLEDLNVVVEEGAQAFLVYTDQPETSTRAYAVDYEIRLPDSFAVSVINVNGEIIVEFVKDSVGIASVNTAVNLDEVEGDVSAEIVNGDISAEVTLLLDSVVDIVVGSGDITLEIPTDTSAEVYLEVVCCGWNFSNLNVQNLEESGPGVFPPTVTGTLGAGQGTISLAVGNGLINVIGV